MAERKLDRSWSSQIRSQNGFYNVPLKENQSYTLVGRSGSGKTTFIYNFLKNIDALID